MFVLYFDVFQVFTFTFSKTCRKSKFLGKKIWRNALALKSKKVQCIFAETFVLALLSPAVFRLQISFNLFCSGDKRLLSEFLRRWGWFQGNNDTWFCRWKSSDNNDINIFLSLENPCTFLLAKVKTWKCIFNNNSELSKSHRKTNCVIQTTINSLYCKKLLKIL